MTGALDRVTLALADRNRIEHELGAGGMATVYHSAEPDRHGRLWLDTRRHPATPGRNTPDERRHELGWGVGIAYRRQLPKPQCRPGLAGMFTSPGDVKIPGWQTSPDLWEVAAARTALDVMHWTSGPAYVYRIPNTTDEVTHGR